MYVLSDNFNSSLWMRIIHIFQHQLDSMSYYLRHPNVSRLTHRFKSNIKLFRHYQVVLLRLTYPIPHYYISRQ